MHLIPKHFIVSEQIEKTVRRATPAAQRRLAGEPKAKPGASLSRSEIRQFLQASRFIHIEEISGIGGTPILLALIAAFG